MKFSATLESIVKCPSGKGGIITTLKISSVKGENGIGDEIQFAGIIYPDSIGNRIGYSSKEEGGKQVEIIYDKKLKRTYYGKSIS